MASWFSIGNRSVSAFGGAAQQTVDALGAELERQARQLADRPQGTADLLTRWVEQSGTGVEAFILDFSECVGGSSASVGKPSDQRKTCEQPLLLSFHEVLLKSRAFEALLDTCCRLPGLAAVTVTVASESPSNATDVMALAEAMSAAAERWLLPGAATVWPSLLQALVSGSCMPENTCPKKGALHWEPWARKVLSVLKKPWQTEALPRMLRQLDRQVNEITSKPNAGSTSESPILQGSSAGRAGGVGMSRSSIRAALAHEQLQQLLSEAVKQRQRVELLCMACECLRAAEKGGGSRTTKLERLLQDANEALSSLNERAEALGVEEEALSRIIGELGGELQKQITGLLMTQHALAEKRIALAEERKALLRKVENLDQELTQLDIDAGQFESQVQQLREQLRGTTQHYENKIESTLCLQKGLSAEKSRAAAFKLAAQCAVDVVQKEDRRLSAEISMQRRRHHAELRRVLAAHLKCHRICLETGVDLSEQVASSAHDVSNGVQATLLAVADSHPQAHLLFRKAQQLLCFDLDEVSAVPADATQSRGIESQTNSSSSPLREDDSTAVDDGLVAEAEVREFFQTQAAEGQQCMDCGMLGADWASVSYGIYLCAGCAGFHRGLGVHVSFVRSTTMDRWSQSQLQRMQRGGNLRFTEFLEGYPRLKHSLSRSAHVPPAALEARYRSRAADFYRQQLGMSSEPADKPPPAEGHLPADVTTEAAALEIEPTEAADANEDVKSRQFSLEEDWQQIDIIFQAFKLPRRGVSSG
mmetsp:Transcript_64352/g.178860  ORF Transcript_64352/g.178860 Transcript_64352/m.178860 type:complete len:762 (-) Transcript_64352:256-2541(-)|eukprot:CAMPEP_0117462016 /NCGR_PEP_ID=MMETSP0784-20121206/2833_1 /TAXON_ID=39447 /ORGANISM="" /LENGTH=761 /DNA_ID=CAMNT_0005255761 /DNA_START=9 /DNA_END=2294 /DNA_ORIENTATION=+